MPLRSRAVIRYSAAVLAVGLAFALHRALEPVWIDRVPFVQFYPTVVFVAWYGGLGPGLLATALSAVAITRIWAGAPAVPLVGTLIALVFFVCSSAVRTGRVSARQRAR